MSQVTERNEDGAGGGGGEMADATDLKSAGSNPVRVRIPPSAPVSEVFTASRSMQILPVSMAWKPRWKAIRLYTVVYFEQVPKPNSHAKEQVE